MLLHIVVPHMLLEIPTYLLPCINVTHWSYSQVYMYLVITYMIIICVLPRVLYCAQYGHNGIFTTQIICDTFPIHLLMCLILNCCVK